MNQAESFPPGLMVNSNILTKDADLTPEWPLIREIVNDTGFPLDI